MKKENTDAKFAAQEAVKQLEAMANPTNAAGMARFGIRTDRALGVSLKDIRTLGKHLGKSTPVALELMSKPYHEAHLLAFVTFKAGELSEEQLDAIAATLDSWDTCDVFCGEIADHPLAFRRALDWVRDEREFVRRAGFSLMARMSVRCKDLPDEVFQPLLAIAEHYSPDPRPMVGKAIEWAVRQIGKRSTFLHPYALSLAEKMAASDDKHTRRIGRTASRELSRSEIIARLKPHKVWPEEGVVEIDGYC